MFIYFGLAMAGINSKILVIQIFIDIENLFN